MIDRYGDLLAANPAFDVMTEGAAPELIEPPVNVFRLALHPAGAADRIVNSGELAQHVLERLDAELLRTPDARLAELHTELDNYARHLPKPSNLLGRRRHSGGAAA